MWRIHNDLYDLTGWLENHPGKLDSSGVMKIKPSLLGGKDWLLLTKGTDCTEAFESFHVFGVSQSILTKFWVKKAKSPRRYR